MGTSPRPRRPRVPEKTEQAHIVQLLRSVGARVWVLGTRRRRGDYPGTMQTPGVPDLVAFVLVRDRPKPRRLLWVEVKAEGGYLRPEQAEFASLCDAAGVAHVVGGLDAVLARLVSWGVVRADGIAHYRRPKGA